MSLLSCVITTPNTNAQSVDPGILSSQAVGSADVAPLAAALGAVGSSDFPATGSSEPNEAHPSPVDPTITRTEVVGKRQDGRAEIWTIASAAMQRRVDVEVYRAATGTPAPMLYMLDGVNSPLPSGWRSLGGVDQYFADKNVNVVVPTGGYASFWSDWQNDDPALGRNKWETFLTTELPGLVEPALSTNGRRGIAGISMGGQAAMHLASAHPEMYQGVASISGTYSTSDEIGYQTARLTVETRGGAVRNMWGPRGSAAWQAHDTLAHPDGLRGKAVYLSTGNGIAGIPDTQAYNGDAKAFATGILLEKAVLHQTRAFDDALRALGIDHVTDYTPTGLHNWKAFAARLDPAWTTLVPALGG